MFMINTNPLRHHKTIQQYSHLLFKQYAIPHFSRGTSEVHFVFDNPKRMKFNPKNCEHKRRYSQATTTNRKHSHTCITFTPDSEIPKPWRQNLECRECKRSIVEALAVAYCNNARTLLREGQTLVLAGCLSGQQQDCAWILTKGDLYPKLTDMFLSNAQEADMRVWRHALQTHWKRILIYSPDTDVYNIGLSMLKPGCQYIVQINLPHHQARYVNLNMLLKSFQADPDLASLQQNKLASIMQQLYICSGCDYVSYLSGAGKVMFLNCFFQHAEFITGITADGDLSMTDNEIKTGFLSLVRLFGTIYFRKNLATVVSRLGFDTPIQLYNSLDNSDVEDQHTQWYMKIRGVLPVVHEDQRPPTLTALWRHWQRCCWVKHMWKNCSKADQYDGLASPESQGWVKDGTEWKIDWEAEEVKKKIKLTLDFLTKGCSCKSGCKTKRCGCRRGEQVCGAGCECRGCTNVTTTMQHEEEVEEEQEDENEEDEEHEEDEEDEEDEEEEEFVEDENQEEMEEDMHIQTEVVSDPLDDMYIYWS